MKKNLILAFILFFQAALFTAFGQDQNPDERQDNPVSEDTEKSSGDLNDYKKVDGMENWNYYYDLTGYKKGTYNLIIKGVDKSGNVFYRGPINIYIDPESDVPIANISNPSPMMRVGGKNLNIVGTCIDDDAVSYVEVKLDDGEFVRAEGAEFWSYYLDTATLVDGLHTITVQGYDINNIASEPVTSQFNLDTANPINKITSHPNGVLVTGKVTIEGQVADLNGVDDLALSTDGGKIYEPLKFSYDKKENIYSFSVSINTEKLDDGPHIYWFRSKDKTRSVGYSAFLFFVDNTDPVISIIDPGEDASVNGKTFISGKAIDEIGIARLTFETETENGDIPMIPGNPYWVKEFDFSGIKGKTADVTFAAQDVTGNITTTKVKFPIDREADLPLVSLAKPQADELVEGDVMLSGFVSDDDGVKEISWNIDGGESVTREVSDAFNFSVDDPGPGPHTLNIKSIDVNGQAGNPVSIKFTRVGTTPEISINSLNMKGQESAFYPGIEVFNDGSPMLNGRIKMIDKIQKAVYRFKDGEFANLSVKKGEGEDQLFEINIGKAVQYGINTLDIEITDVYDRVSEFTTFIYVRNYTRINEEPGIYFAEGAAGSAVTITDSDPFTCVYAGDAIKTAELVPEAASVRLRRDGNLLKVVPQGSGTSGKVKIRVTTIYDEVIESKALSFINGSGTYASDDQGLGVRLVRAAGTGWVSDWSNGIQVPDGTGKLLIEGNCGLSVNDGDISFNGGAPKKLSIKAEKGASEKNFLAELPGDLPFGRVDITVTVRDKEKNSSQISAFYFKVAQADAGSIIDDEKIYISDSSISGSNVFLKQDAVLGAYLNGRKISSAELEPASDFLKISHDDHYIQVKAASPGVSEQTKIKVTTVNGREFYSGAFRFVSDNKAPVISLTSPSNGEWLQGSIEISGTVSDNLGVKKLEFSLDNGVSFKPVEVVEAENGLSFSIVPSQKISDGDVSILVRAEDINGNISSQTANVKRDTKPAAVKLVTPLPDDTVNGRITVIGKADDDGRIDYVEFSDSVGEEGPEFKKIDGTGTFSLDIDFSSYETLPEEFIIQVHDKSGNITRFVPKFSVDTEIDKPVATIQVPENMEVLKNDFVISGMAFDDDGVKNIYYQLDENPAGKLDGSNNFQIPVKLDDISDNEHTIKVWAEDLGGLVGDTDELTFVISKAEPVSLLTSPLIEKTVQGKITLEGTAADNNGIKEVYVSFDNANTYNLATGRENWTYTFDSNVISDGTYSVYIKALDNTNTEGISTSLINIDNTPPVINLDYPADGDIISDTILLDGRAFDNISLSGLKAVLSPLKEKITAVETDGEAAAEIQPLEPAEGEGRVFELPVDGNFSQRMDLDGLAPGWYNIRVEAVDNADNMCYVSKNIRIQETVNAESVDIIFPLGGSQLNGYFSLSGKVNSSAEVSKVTVFIDDEPADVAEVNEYGFYHLDFGTGDKEGEITLADGPHTMRVEATLEGQQLLSSDNRKILYSRKGGYVTITSMKVGQSISERPWLRGTAGYFLDPVEKSEGDLYDEYQTELKENKIEKIEISLDNGKSFRKAKGTTKWRYRLETLEMPDGELPIIVRAVYNNRTSVVKTICMVDNTPPDIRLLTPDEGRHFNEELVVLGTAQDENGLDQVYINLRKGSKSGYAVPSFIQGLYVDGHFLGSTDWEAGLGLTFFDQVVKVQANIGHAPYQREGNTFPERFYGTTLSVKILANVADIPFGALFRNHDLDFLSMSVAVGANFTYFSMVPEGAAFYNPDEPYVIIGALLMQIEFPKIEIDSKLPVFKTISAYTEGSASFISSDVFPEIMFKISFGVRLGIL